MTTILHKRKVPYPAFDGTQHCAGLDTDDFYPAARDEAEFAADRSYLDAHSLRVPRRVCQGCPFRPPCLEWAIENENHGMWGGTSEAERRRIRRLRAGLEVDPEADLIPLRMSPAALGLAREAS